MSSSVARAQCTKDTDCKGNRVCEEGVCKADPTLAAPPDEAPAPAPAPPPTPAAAPAPATAARWSEPAPEPVRYERHSTGMMVGGIVMVSAAPLGFLTSLVAATQKSNCELGDIYADEIAIRTNCDGYDPAIYGGLIAGGVLVAVGIPLIVIGGKREPVATATVAPFASAHAGGVGVRATF